MVERKCPNCLEWNGSEDFCKSCGAPLSYKEIRKAEIAVRIREEAEKPPSKVEIWIDRGKHSKNLGVRIMFYILFSVWFTVMGVGSFVTWLIAWSAA